MAAARRQRAGAAKAAHAARTAGEALAFVERHGAVLLSARGAAPSLAEWIAGEPIRGSWWAHARGHEIYALAGAITASPDLLVCRLIAGKVTYLHRRLWPALVRAQAGFARERLARVVEEHTARGHHETRAEAYPRWVPAQVRSEAKALALEDALAQLAAAGVTP